MHTAHATYYGRDVVVYSAHSTCVLHTNIAGVCIFLNLSKVFVSHNVLRFHNLSQVLLSALVEIGLNPGRRSFLQRGSINT